ncbi:hypothetical protein I6I98_08665 [Sphingobacterium multivorum]|uniref:DUF7710 domain-containing protein n=1 Tax=Sphingobacterium multivorum TaxID=28454 RepID=A0ABX7CT74_SPHMU|nr:hypothetical protein [Sphingobacterium multivorum]QQT55309.1 hypothetical protein I6I98_08665 [Sphingobacterium multivorum]
MLDTLWVFHGEGGRFSSGVLIVYPIDEGVYDWALFNDFFNVKKQAQMEANFIQQFTSATQEHIIMKMEKIVQ